MSQSEETLDSDTTHSGSVFHLGLQSPDPDPTPILDLSPHDLSHSAVETEHGESTLEHRLQNLDLEEEAEGEVKEKGKEEETEEKDDGGRESNDDVNGNGDGDEGEEDEGERNDDEVYGENVNKNEGKRSHYPARPEAEDCAFYMKTGLCKFGYNCKFNHPLRRKNQDVKEKDESTEKPSQTECKYYQRTGGCKFGKACRYNHSTAKSSTGLILELNFLGLPIRQGERECPYYMRNGSCKYGTNCRFNHPDPTTSGACDPPSGYGNGGSVSSQAAPQVNMMPWSLPRALNETAPYMPVMFFPPQVVPQPKLEWNGYQAPVYPPLERSLHATPAYVMNNLATESAVYTHNLPQTTADKFPERPGQPECSYFLKTGDCKFKSNCRYHHPKIRVSKPTLFVLSDKGLPLRSDQTICSHYSCYGICKFGPACKFDHSRQEAPSTMSGLDDQSPTFSHSAATEQTHIAGATDTTVQQAV